jgi:hypothetical protein
MSRVVSLLFEHRRAQSPKKAGKLQRLTRSGALYKLEVMFKVVEQELFSLNLFKNVFYASELIYRCVFPQKTKENFIRELHKCF